MSHLRNSNSRARLHMILYVAVASTATYKMARIRNLHFANASPMRKECLVTIAVMSVLVMLAGCRTQAPAKPGTSDGAYECRFVSSSITIDGKLDEQAWKQGGTIDKFYVYKPKDAKHLSRTIGRVLWDRRNLYVSYECEDDDIWSYSDKPDDELWNGDVVEFFVKPSVTDNTYYEFVMAPNAALYDGRYPSRGSGGYLRFKGWSSGALVATSRHKAPAGYTVEMAIPLTAFAGAVPPSDGVTWTFGMFRYDYSKSFEAPLLLMSIQESPESGFHYYEGYHRLRFTKP